MQSEETVRRQVPVTSRRAIVRTGVRLGYAAPAVAVSIALGTDRAAAVSGQCLSDGVDCFHPINTPDVCDTCCSGASVYRGFGATICGACIPAGVFCRLDSFEETCHSCCNGQSNSICL